MKKYTAYFVIECQDKQDTYSEAGFIPADTFHEAMDYIEEYYGNDLAVVNHLELLDISMFTMSIDMAERLLADLY